MARKPPTEGIHEFRNLSLGTKFMLDGIKYEKVKPEMLSCCRQKNNAIHLETEERVLINQKSKVEICR